MNRIRIIISEGFLRDSLSTPFERVKNLVAFSFQHAPLGQHTLTVSRGNHTGTDAWTDILESSGIAWPNPSMWQRSPSTSSMAAQTYTSPITESHAHSPRRQLEPLFTPPALTTTRSKFPMIGNSRETSSRGENRATDRMFARESRQHRSTDGSMDWIAEPASSSTPQSSFQTAIQALRKARMSNTDESMPDYVSRFEEPEKPTAPDQSDEDCCFKHPKAPSNTPADTSDPSNPDSVDGAAIFTSCSWCVILTRCVRLGLLYFSPEHVHPDGPRQLLDMLLAEAAAALQGPELGLTFPSARDQVAKGDSSSA